MSNKKITLFEFVIIFLIVNFSRFIQLILHFVLSFVLKDIFNITKPNIHEDYIANINMLVSKINHFSNEYTEEYFLNNHTISSLYVPFMNGNDITSRSLNNFVKSRKRFTWDIPEKEHFHYCSDCIKEELENYGECF